MSKKQNVHVVKHEDGWAVKTEGSRKAAKALPTQKEAITHGRDMAIKRESELRIHGIDGKIRNLNSYGNDPNPPKDTKN